MTTKTRCKAVKTGLLSLYGLRNRYLSEIYPTYDWINDEGYDNLSKWIEKAAEKVER
jgi:hypothetical protein